MKIPCILLFTLKIALSTIMDNASNLKKNIFLFLEVFEEQYFLGICSLMLVYYNRLSVDFATLMFYQ